MAEQVPDYGEGAELEAQIAACLDELRLIDDIRFAFAARRLDKTIGRIVDEHLAQQQSTSDQLDQYVRQRKEARIRTGRKTIAGLVDPIDMTHRSALEQLEARTSLAARSVTNLRKRAEAIAKPAGLNPEILLENAQPFATEEELETWEGATDSPDLYRRLLQKLGVKPVVDTARPKFTDWGLERDEFFVEPTTACFVIGCQAKFSQEREYDRFRALIILAATLTKMEEPGAYGYVIGAMDMVDGIIDPEQRVRAYLMLKEAMNYAWGLNTFNRMAMMNEEIRPTMRLETPASLLQGTLSGNS